MQVALTDATFKTASWDWVQDTATATTKWHAIGDWDVSGVADMSHAFSQHRNAAGGSYVLDGNSANIASFTGGGLDLWIMSSLTTLDSTFMGASEMNVDFGSWDVTQVSTMTQTFRNAAKFEGEGLSTWNVAAVTSLTDTFTDATALTSCNKRKIVDAWTPISAVFVATTYDTAWAGEPWCVGAALSDAQFKQATWGTYV